MNEPSSSNLPAMNLKKKYFMVIFVVVIMVMEFIIETKNLEITSGIHVSVKELSTLHYILFFVIKIQLYQAFY